MEKLKITRERYTSKNGDDRYSYSIKGEIRGRELKADLLPSDINGYALLDVLFLDGEVFLNVLPYSIKDEKSGEIIKGNSYQAISIDSNGEELICPIKSKTKSDKAILDMLIKLG